MARSVYCRWCYEKGHNRRTCPEYTQRIKERAESEVKNNKKLEEGSGSTYLQEEYADRTKADQLLDGTPYNREKQGRSETVRRCSYCAKSDHNRRTCQEFKDCKVKFVERTKLYRELMAETLIKKGIGIGTLMANPSVFKNEHNSDAVNIYMVDRIEWDSISIRSARSVSNVIYLKNINSNEDNYWHRNDRLPFPPPHKLLKKNIKVFADDPSDWSGFKRSEDYWNNDNDYNSTMVVSPIDPKIVKQMIPENWTDLDTIDKSDVVKEYFDGAQSPDYYDNKWND